MRNLWVLQIQETSFSVGGQLPTYAHTDISESSSPFAGNTTIAYVNQTDFVGSHHHVDHGERHR